MIPFVISNLCIVLLRMVSSIEYLVIVIGHILSTPPSSTKTLHSIAPEYLLSKLRSPQSLTKFVAIMPVNYIYDIFVIILHMGDDFFFPLQGIADFLLYYYYCLW